MCHLRGNEGIGFLLASCGGGRGRGNDVKQPYPVLTAISGWNSYIRFEETHQIPWSPLYGIDSAPAFLQGRFSCIHGFAELIIEIERQWIFIIYPILTFQRCIFSRKSLPFSHLFVAPSAVLPTHGPPEDLWHETAITASMNKNLLKEKFLKFLMTNTFSFLPRIEINDLDF